MLRVILLAMVAGLAGATTLERLSLDEMIVKSTAVLRGRVTSSYTAVHGPMIYTHFLVTVAERWKGPATGQGDIVIPGGTYRGLRQSISGAPKVTVGSEYVFFLWTSRTGLTHIIGLSQGVFDLKVDSDGETQAFRTASADAMLDPVTGKPVKDDDVMISLRDLRARIGRVLAGVRE